jgi:hypothetical protein
MSEVTMSVPASALEEVAEIVVRHREAAAALTREEEAQERRIARARHGTRWRARKPGYCPMCRREIDPGDEVVIMDNYHPWNGRARSDAFCLSCADARGFES